MRIKTYVALAALLLIGFSLAGCTAAKGSALDDGSAAPAAPAATVTTAPPGAPGNPSNPAPAAPAAPAPVNPPVINPPAPAQPAPQGRLIDGQPSTCPTDGQMQTAFGFTASGVKPVFTGEGVAWEPCKWNWIATGRGTLEFQLLEGWEATVTRADDVVAVYYGPVSLKIKGMTLRHLPSYSTPESSWANNHCELLKREDEFGMRRNPAYHTIAGNFSCSNGSSAAPAPAPAAPVQTQVQPAPARQAAPAPQTRQAAAPAAKKQDNQVNNDWLVTNVGGSNWTPPDWEGGAWTYRGAEVPLKYPGKGKLDVWLNGGPVSITSANAGELAGKTFDGASYHPNG